MSNLIILDVSVRQDELGRFCINDLHRASGGEKKNGPGYWLENQQIQELIEEMEITGNPVIQSKQGLGTFVAKELVYAYAMWVSPSFHLKVIRAYDDLVNQKTDVKPAPSVVPASKEFKATFSILRLVGLDRNAAAISANQSTVARTGIDFLGMTGTTHLIAENQETRWHTPTELGKTINVSGRQFNMLLTEAGLQVRVHEEWEPTEAAYGLYRLFDTGKKHSSGTPVQQMKWSDAVLKLINKQEA